MIKSANPILKQALSACYSGFAAVVVFSLFINVLMLTAPLYMLQIFDRVIAARSEDTLLYLTLIAGVALLTLAALEMSRTRIMVGLGTWLDQRLSGTVLEGSIGKSVAAAGTPSIQGLRDLSTIRTFLTGSEMFPILDSPWTPIFIAAIFMMHPILGWLSLGGAIVLFGLAIANDLATRNLLRRSGGASFTALRQAESAVRNAHVIEAMGMMPNLVGRWHAKNTEMLDLQARASRRAGAITATSKFIRQCLQISVLGTGAWLMLGGEITAGIMIASSILMARALAPIEQAIGSWRSAIAARGAYERVRDQLATTRVRGAKITLPRPEGRLKVEGVTFFHPDGVAPTLGGVSFELEPGEALGLVGSTAAGKSTLAALLVGIAKPRLGHVRLDGADMADWAAEDLGRHIGYLPQDIELFAGTVRDNIARMGEADPESVISAAQLAGVHELILQLPSGYETEIGEAGAVLSGGQRQRIALARAVFGHPRFVVLDEPNASLDAAGEEALINAIAALKKRGATVVVIAHRPSILRHVDKALVLRAGAVEAFGPPSQVLSTVTRAQPATSAQGA
ncbi:MAG: type I secretion system permease/ATPase [Alphaproteobacteria bacterium]|jgi:ATP-binding cassette subfamily B protein/ATP-binding cassette subfamily C protein|nr:type I secretion system permease/ATPase [Alphaproteobacteria bacterium]MDP7173446.1 type I secretion system permease/ATPase [Alphaproteobacteria bacterium]MDP7233574.1 type I secretion system permease/ATPase [Alphaproteobacteria bacterium]MDP7487004.1 type I secretion system permease/ATPase [Alphaproteobacteria bacterium]|tara:strand:- start:5004 stop:6707 length:1704 start_codon:yes stop_codon:yes gene_type:complete